MNFLHVTIHLKYESAFLHISKICWCQNEIQRTVCISSAHLMSLGIMQAYIDTINTVEVETVLKVSLCLFDILTALVCYISILHELDLDNRL